MPVGAHKYMSVTEAAAESALLGDVQPQQTSNNNNNKHFFNLQVANSPSRLRFEANLSRESSECTEHSQDQTSQINTGKTVYVGNA